MTGTRPPTRVGQPASHGEASSMSLLARLRNGALDQGYRAVRADPARADTRGARALALVAVAVFGLLVATTAVRAQRAAPAVEEERAGLVAQVERRSAALDRLRDQVVSLRGSITQLEHSSGASATALRALHQELGLLQLTAGAVRATGPGVRVVVDDAPYGTAPGRRGTVVDVDLQKVVNGLWAAGAEAVAVDGHRLTSLSAIRGAGDAITVNFTSITPPYVIGAIGNPDTLPARLLETPAAQTMLDLEANFGLRFDVVPSERVTVPADPRLATCCRHILAASR